MFTELLADSRMLTGNLRTAHSSRGQFGDIGTTSLIETGIDETERRIWFLVQSTE